MNPMFLRGRLQWTLLAVTLISGGLALFFAQRNDSGVESVPTTIAATTSTTTTVYQPPITYVVQRGDTLFAIASSFQVDMQALMDLNGITNPDRVEAGDELVMPPATGFVPVAPSTTMLP
jgi:LysM repeat protein